MNRIDQAFARSRAGDPGRKLLIPYITAGDGGAERSLNTLLALAQHGADIIELGMPFSDPMADGPVIQQACERALDAGMNLAGVLALVRRFRAANPAMPLVLMGYLNPVWRYGIPEFADAAATAGVDGVLIVDAPPEESAGLHQSLADRGLHQIMLAAPTSSAARMQAIASMAGGFIYYVALKGVTGAANLDQGSIVAPLSELRRHTGLPLAVGFGIKNAADARAVAPHADAVVIGSALVAALAAEADVSATVQQFMTPIREALDGVCAEAR